MVNAFFRLSRRNGRNGYMVVGMVLGVTKEDIYTEIERLEFCIVPVKSNYISWQDIQAMSRKKVFPYIPENSYLSDPINLDELELTDAPQPPEL